MRFVIVGSLVASASAGICTAAQKAALMGDVQVAIDAVGYAGYATSAAYVTAALDELGTVDYPCSNCVSDFLASGYAANGGASPPCAAGLTATDCVAAITSGLTKFNACAAGQASSAQSAAVASAALIMAAWTLL